MVPSVHISTMPVLQVLALCVYDGSFSSLAASSFFLSHSGCGKRKLGRFEVNSRAGAADATAAERVPKVYATDVTC